MSKNQARRKVVVSLVAGLLLSVAAPLAAEDGDLPKPARPAALAPLYISFGTLQALDVHSTFRALGNGGREANPIIGNMLGTPAGVVALKGAATIGIIYMAEKVSRRNRTAAVLTMIGLNSAYAMVVARNYSIARRR
jgi:hypothetical protein